MKAGDTVTVEKFEGRDLVVVDADGKQYHSELTGDFIQNDAHPLLQRLAREEYDLEEAEMSPHCYECCTATARGNKLSFDQEWSSGVDGSEFHTESEFEVKDKDGVEFFYEYYSPIAPVSDYDACKAAVRASLDNDGCGG